jgi:hypothetical protein
MNLNNVKNKFSASLLVILVPLVSVDRALGVWQLEGTSVISQAAFIEDTANQIESGDILKDHQVFETVQGVLLDLCEKRDYGEDCAKVLLGILWKESLNDSRAIGDGGRARGYFQIHYRLHGISLQCAEDLSCSANWTLDYLERNGYPRHVTYAVQCHNGCGFTNGYWQSVLRWGNRKWNTPLFIDPPQTEIVLR